MTDIAIIWNPQTQQGDIAIANGDFVADDSLRTAVIMSLFTDARARDNDDIPDGTDDPRGWWADVFLERAFGSRLWLLDRAKRVPETLRRAEDYAREALLWLVDDGIAREIECSAEFSNTITPIMLLTTRIARPRDINSRWQETWEITLNG